VIEVVQISPAYGQRAQRVEARGRMLDGDRVVLRLVGQRDESNEPARLVLKRAKLPQVVHAVGERFDVAEEHRAGAAPAHAMPGAVHVEVFLGALLPARDGGADFRAENLRAAAGERIEPGGFELGEHVRERFFSPATRDGGFQSP